MKKGIPSVFIAFVLLTIFFSACTPAAPAITPTISLPTDTSVPTNTFVPTNTPEPTQTPIPPTATVAAPDKTLEYLNGVQVVYIDTFDNPSTSIGWGFDAGTVKAGGLEVIGNNWNGLLRERAFKDNQGIIVDFIYSRGAVFEMLLDSGDWYTDPYKRFGVYMEKNYARVNVWAGKNGLGGASLSGNFAPKPDTLYSVLIGLLPNGEFLGVIWNPADPSQTIRYHEKIGKNWSNLTWKFRIGADKGTILFDNYREITFDSVK